MKDKIASLNIIEGAIRKASKYILRDYYELETLQSSLKSTHNFVSKTISKAKEIISFELSKFHHDYDISFDGKENIYSGGSDKRFVISIFDNILSFSKAHNFFNVTILLEQTKDNITEIITSIVYEPLLTNIYFSGLSRGAFIEQHYQGSNPTIRKLRVSSLQDLENAFIGAEFGKNDILSLSINLFPHNHICSLPATTLLTMVASGKLDFCIIDSENYAARFLSYLLIREAGGFIINHKLKGRNIIIATNANLYKTLLGIIKKTIAE